MPLVSPLREGRGRRGRLAGAVALATALVGGLLLVPVTAANAAPVQDASNEAARQSQGQGWDHWGQTFVAQRSGALVAIDIDSAALGQVQVHSTAGVLAAGVLATSDSVVSVDGGWRRFGFSTPVLVTAGVTYAFSFPDAQNLPGYTGNAYGGGHMIHRDVNGVWQDPWGDAYDLRFRTFVETEPPTITGAPVAATRGTAYSYPFEIGGPASTSTVTSGQLPDGLAMDSAGVVSGTPTVSGDFTFTVSTVGNGQTVTHDASITVTGAPTAVLDLAGSGANGAIDLTWTAPSDLGNSGAVSYGVTATPNSGSGAPFSGTTSATSFRVPGLDNALDYTVTVTPSNTLGAGDGQSVVVAPPAAPSVPTALAAVPSDQRVTVTWSAPVSTGGSPVSYELRTRAAGGEWSEPAPATSPTTLDGLANGEVLDVEVRAVNRVLSSDWVSISGTPRTVADVPSILNAVPGDRSATVSWAAPEWNGGAEITGWIVEHRVLGTEAWIASDPVAASELQATVSGLRNGTEYEFRVAAVNPAGTSEPSWWIWATPFTTPGAPVFTLHYQLPGELHFTWQTPTDEGGRSVDGYVLEHRVTGTDEWIALDEYAAYPTEATVTGLAAGTDYEFRLRATNEAGAGTPSTTVSARYADAASAPGDFTVVIGDGTADLSWSVPTADGGSPIERYEVVWYIEGQMHSNEQLALGTSARVTGLPNGEPVRFWVHAITAAGAGEDAELTAVLFGFTPEVLDEDGEVVTKVRPGQKLVLADSELPEGAIASAELHSTPVKLGSEIVGADGELALAVQVPTSTTLGEHEL
ncbi:MAG: fibronectin type III domain-containing protein, partial [Aeromicrobium sp.]